MGGWGHGSYGLYISGKFGKTEVPFFNVREVWEQVCLTTGNW